MRPGSLVLDIGAFVGNRTQDYLDAGAGKVLAFEPNPATFRKLAARFRGDTRVQPVPCALSDRSGQVVLGHPTGLEGGSSIVGDFAEWIRERSADGELVRYSVNVRRLDELDIPQASYWKIDVEGSERALLAGAQETLRTKPPEALQMEMFVRDAEVAAATLESLAEAFPYVWMWGVGDDNRLEAHAFPFKHMNRPMIDLMHRRLGTPMFGAARIDPRGIDHVRWVTE